MDIAATPGHTTAQTVTAFDAATAQRHVGQATLARVGASDHAYGDDRIEFAVQCGRARRRVTVTLNGDDTYRVEIRQYRRKTLEWITQGSAASVHAAELGAAVERLYLDVFDR